MSNNVRFTVTALPPDKKGKLQQDDEGYYKVNLGALNTFNSIGEYYVRKEAEDLFLKNADLMRRVNNGRVKCEEGHPVFETGMSDTAFMYRAYEIREANVSGIFRAIELDFDAAEALRGKGQISRDERYQGDLLPVVGWVKPAGPLWKSLALAFENKYEDICFSVRGFTDDYVANGITYRFLREIITYDRVNEPGVEHASKWKQPALESRIERPITRSFIDELLSPGFAKLATEDSKVMANKIIKIYNRASEARVKNPWEGW